MDEEAQRLVDALVLKPHPEGGYFRETYRSSILVRESETLRVAATSIYYLLNDQSFSAFHRLASDEIWHHYRGASVAIEVIQIDGEHRRVVIGEGDRWQAVIHAGAWFAAHLSDAAGYALVGCDVAPGFDFERFELASREGLLGAFPQHRRLIERWTHPT